VKTDNESDRHDPDQRCRSTAAQKWRMAPLSKIEVGAIAIIVFSLAVIAFVLFSILATS
jgi:hypothetical protein